MGNRAQQLVACYLAVCLALAGVVGLSPALHRLIEHGAHGPAHIHVGGSQAETWHDDGNGHFHKHAAPPSGRPEEKPKRLFAHQHEFGLPKIPVRALLRLASQWLRTEATNPSSDADGPRHHHDSLPQLVASGLLDQHLERDLLSILPPAVFLAEDAVDTALLVGDLNPQTAPRAPPSQADLLARS